MTETVIGVAFMATFLPAIAAFIAGGFGELVKAFTEKMPSNESYGMPGTVYPFAGDFVAEFGEAVDA